MIDILLVFLLLTLNTYGAVKRAAIKCVVLLITLSRYLSAGKGWNKLSILFITGTSVPNQGQKIKPYSWQSRFCSNVLENYSMPDYTFKIAKLLRIYYLWSKEHFQYDYMSKVSSSRSGSPALQQGILFLRIRTPVIVKYNISRKNVRKKRIFARDR